MQILSSKQLKEADAYTIANEPIKSIELMERAAKKCTDWIAEHFSIDFHFHVFCGKGNNGGDGLAIARILLERKYHVSVIILEYSTIPSEDFQINLMRLLELSIQNTNCSIKHVSSSIDFQTYNFASPNSIIIDAILGYGLNKPTIGLIAETIQFINRQTLPKICIDIPTGLFADAIANNTLDNTIAADITLTFQTPKLTFLLPETGNFVGQLVVLDIGLSAEYMRTSTNTNNYVTHELAKTIFKKRNKFSHKGNYGHSLLIAGSYGKIGAAILSAKACLKAGAGLVTVYIPKCGYTPMQTAVPECMVITSDHENYLNAFYPKFDYNAVGFGPGIGMEKDTQNALKFFLQNNASPVVFDADAINILAENKTWLSFIQPGTIFTPHVKELERLVGRTSNSIDRIELAKEFAFKYQSYVVLKGAHTCIIFPNKELFFNSTGNPGMATAGSGDALTGIITSLLAQGYTSADACILGVFIHGKAGDIAANELSEESLIASDIINSLGNAFSTICK
ncbi:MAG: NAD(P)H-hydrate dehydratase [Bacteroidetes bacterium]|nr:NAD(P)H-hydrate dehydratase [Bacteroidota bacterium]